MADQLWLMTRIREEEEEARDDTPITPITSRKVLKYVGFINNSNVIDASTVSGEKTFVSCEKHPRISPHIPARYCQ